MSAIRTAGPSRSDIVVGAIVVSLGLAVAAYVAAAIAGVGSAPSRYAASSAPVEMHYSPAEDLEAIDVALIGEAGETIDMAAYVLTDVPVIEALTTAAQRGVEIRLYRFPDEHEERAATASALAELISTPGVTQRFKRGADLMHLKSYCVDGAVLRGGAANFSASGLKRQDNDLDVFRGAGVCARFEQAFAAMWRDGA